MCCLLFGWLAAGIDDSQYFEDLPVELRSAPAQVLCVQSLLARVPSLLQAPFCHSHLPPPACPRLPPPATPATPLCRCRGEIVSQLAGEMLRRSNMFKLLDETVGGRCLHCGSVLSVCVSACIALCGCDVQRAAFRTPGTAQSGWLSLRGWLHVCRLVTGPPATAPAAPQMQAQPGVPDF